MKIRDFLKLNELKTITIGPDEPVKAAIQKLVDNNIGALPVCDEDGSLLGIISERDLLKECLLNAGAMSSTKVREVMTQDVAVGSLDDDLEYAANVMKNKRIRHLPIVTGQKIESIISLRDTIETKLKETEAEVHYVGLIRRTHRSI